MDRSLGRYGGRDERGGNADTGGQSRIDSKNIISDAKYCFRCVEKLTATWGLGDTVVIPEIDAGERFFMAALRWAEILGAIVLDGARENIE